MPVIGRSGCDGNAGELSGSNIRFSWCIFSGARLLSGPAQFDADRFATEHVCAPLRNYA
jgi:hypothetical protein